MVEREPTCGTADSRQGLVRDQERAPLGAELTHGPAPSWQGGDDHAGPSANSTSTAAGSSGVARSIVSTAWSTSEIAFAAAAKAASIRRRRGDQDGVGVEATVLPRSRKDLPPLYVVLGRGTRALPDSAGVPIAESRVVREERLGVRLPNCVRKYTAWPGAIRGHTFRRRGGWTKALVGGLFRVGAALVISLVTSICPLGSTPRAVAANPAATVIANYRARIPALMADQAVPVRARWWRLRVPLRSVVAAPARDRGCHPDQLGGPSAPDQSRAVDPDRPRR